MGGGSSAGGGSFDRSGGGVDSDGRLTRVEWWEAKLDKMKVLTGKPGDTLAKSDADQIREAFRMSAWDPKPTLLYFHWDHEEGELGKVSEKQCKLFDDETVARWSMLFHCVEVEMTTSDKNRLKRFGAGDRPSFAVVDQNMKVLAESHIVSNSKQLVAFLKKTAKESFPDFWKQVQEELAEQKKMIKEAKALARKKDYQEALDNLQIVAQSPYRIGPWWEDAVKDVRKLEKKIRKDG